MANSDFTLGREVARLVGFVSDGQETAFRPSRETIRKISALLDISQRQTRKALDTFVFT